MCCGVGDVDSATLLRSVSAVSVLWLATEGEEEARPSSLLSISRCWIASR